MTPPTAPPAWHQALLFALTGVRDPGLGRQDRPDVVRLAELLRDRLPEDLPATSGPHPLPPDLAVGIGPAQLAAALTELRTRLRLDRRPVPPVVADRPLTPDELRLLREVPPHHQ